MTTRQITRAAMVAALYASLTMAVAPISYGPIQFRVAEVLKGLALFDPIFIVGFAVGNLLSNLTSPYAGPWEWVFMPFANVVGASLCWLLRGVMHGYVGALVYALVITLAVSFMLSVVVGVPLLLTLPFIGVSEAVLIVGGVPLMTMVWRAVESL